MFSDLLTVFYNYCTLYNVLILQSMFMGHHLRPRRSDLERRWEVSSYSTCCTFLFVLCWEVTPSYNEEVSVGIPVQPLLRLCWPSTSRSHQGIYRQCLFAVTCTQWSGRQCDYFSCSPILCIYTLLETWEAHINLHQCYHEHNKHNLQINYMNLSIIRNHFSCLASSMESYLKWKKKLY